MLQYRVIWIDDEWDKMPLFQEECRESHNIELIPFRNRKEGMEFFERQIESIRACLTDNPSILKDFYKWVKRTNPKDAQILKKNQSTVLRLLRINEIPKNKSPPVGITKSSSAQSEDQPQPEQGPQAVVPPSIYEEKFKLYFEFFNDDKNAQRAFTNLHEKYNTIDPADLCGVFVSCDKNENEVIKKLS